MPVLEREAEKETGLNWNRLLTNVLPVATALIIGWVAFEGRLSRVEVAVQQDGRRIDQVEQVNRQQDTYNNETREITIKTMNEIKDMVRDIQVKIVADSK
jgi:hypothetical protein